MTLIRGYVISAPLREAFETYLHAMRRSPATSRAYLAVVDRWLRACGDAGMGDDETMLRYLKIRRDRVGQASMNMEISALKAWFRWLRIALPAAWQPTTYPRQRKLPPRVVRALTDAEVGILLAAPDLTTFVGLRDHVIMATLYQCGLRASELATLELGSVRLDGYLLVRGKGNKDRLVPYGGAWHGLVETYLRQRSTTGPGKRSALFVTSRGKALRNGRSVWVIVNRYARAALGTACGYTRLERTTGGRPWQGHYPHLLRASFATELHRNGVNIMAVSQLLGHADVKTTAHYVGADLDQLRAAVGHHPRASRVSTVASTPDAAAGTNQSASIQSSATVPRSFGVTRNKMPL